MIICRGWESSEVDLYRNQNQLSYLQNVDQMTQQCLFVVRITDKLIAQRHQLKLMIRSEKSN